MGCMLQKGTHVEPECLAKKVGAYIARGESAERKLGVEMEHFLVRADDLTSVPYQGGVEEFLRDMIPSGWEPVNQGPYLMGLKGKEGEITLEPGGQVEISLYPSPSVSEIEGRYISFLDQIRPLLRERGWALACTGYRPADGIDSIPLLPKERYRSMYRYFTRYGGPYAHHMMKGTAALQVSVDFRDETDFTRKMRAGFFLTPFIAAAFDNVAVFEGKTPPHCAMRSAVWAGCDADRSGVPAEAFAPDFGYTAYGRMLLRRPLILRGRDGRTEDTGKRTGAEVYRDGIDEADIRHLMSMFFFDARAKQYIEIRPGDMLPPDWALGYVAFLKGLLYDPDNLLMLGALSDGVDRQALLALSADVRRAGTRALWQGRPVYTWMEEWANGAIRGLDDAEAEYVERILPELCAGRTPAMLTAERLREGIRAFDWCLIQ